MLVNVWKLAHQRWHDQFTNEDVEILFSASYEAAQEAAKIAREMGHDDVAQRIMDRAGHS